MTYLIEMERAFTAVQGLPSPVRAQRGIAPLPSGHRTDVVLRIGVSFADDQLTDRGWFFDTDAVEELIDACCADLASRTWTERFDFRPTFELVARYAFDRLSAGIAQLAYVELQNRTNGVTTRYLGPRSEA